MKRIALVDRSMWRIVVFIVVAMICCSVAKADPISVFSPNTAWIQFADDDGGDYGSDATGGQPYDTEYFYYQLNGSILSLGLQSGFDVVTGRYHTSNKDYYGGDIALSFDGDISGVNGSGYEYAVDFGLYTEDYYNSDPVGGGGSGIDLAGLYSVGSWNNDLLYPGGATPFAMETGNLIAGALSGNTYGQEGDSYYRIVSFDISGISGISQGDEFTTHAHWTMSCGNDYIDGSFNETNPVPEPATIALLGIGLGVLGGGYMRKRWIQRPVIK